MSLTIETSGLSKNYGKHTALHGVDLAVPPGTVFGVIGPNGAGKTTTMRLLLDIIRPSSGSATCRNCSTACPTNWCKPSATTRSPPEPATLSRPSTGSWVSCS